MTITVPQALATGSAIEPTIERIFDVPVATLATTGLAPDVLTTISALAMATGAGITPVLTLTLPAVSVTAIAQTPTIELEIVSIQGSVVGAGLAPVLALQLPVASATGDGVVPVLVDQYATGLGMVSGVGLVPTLVLTGPVATGHGAGESVSLTLPIGLATGSAQGSNPGVTPTLVAPGATGTGVAAPPVLVVTVEAPKALATGAASAPTFPITGFVDTVAGNLTLSGGTAIMDMVIVVTTITGSLTLDTSAVTIKFGQTVHASQGEIVLSGGRTRMSRGGDPEFEIVSRVDDLETGEEMVTIENEATGESLTRPSKLMHIYRMGYGDEWKKARNKRFGRIS